MKTRATTTRPVRTSKLDLRLSPEAKRTLHAAAHEVNCSVSQFVLTSALERAAETLTERRRFELNTEQWEAFMAALDAPPELCLNYKGYSVNPALLTHL